MNAVGIDVSKGKSTVAFLRPFGEVVRLPFDVTHDYGSLEQLADQIICLDGESRVLMEATGRYHEPVAAALHERGHLCVRAESAGDPRLQSRRKSPKS